MRCTGLIAFRESTKSLLMRRPLLVDSRNVQIAYCERTLLSKVVGAEFRVIENLHHIFPGDT